LQLLQINTFLADHPAYVRKCQLKVRALKNVQARTIGPLWGNDMDEEERIRRFCHAYAMAQRVLDMAAYRGRSARL
jgi:hypothetical protein